MKKPRAMGILKMLPEDFKVNEELGFELNGEGEHVWLYVEKRRQNTLDLCKEIAASLNISPKQISYSGLKDKHAITRQWLSVCTVNEMDFQALALNKAKVLVEKRHTQKLKRGMHLKNDFELVLRELSNVESLENALRRIEKSGVPNYFGEQRFGNSGNNILKAERMFAGEVKVNRHQRGLYLSAARAYLFNEILSERVRRGVWNKGVQGDAMVLAGSNSFFQTDALNDVLAKRLAEFDIHPSVPLWGKGRLPTSSEANKLEGQIIKQYPLLATGLESYGLRQQRRASRLIVNELAHVWLNKETLKLKFSLPRGTFATTVLRELLTIAA